MADKTPEPFLKYRRQRRLYWQAIVQQVAGGRSDIRRGEADRCVGDQGKWSGRIDRATALGSL